MALSRLASSGRLDSPTTPSWGGFVKVVSTAFIGAYMPLGTAERPTSTGGWPLRSLAETEL
jgi:hypothetical protein